MKKLALLLVFALPTFAQNAPKTLTLNWTNTDSTWGSSCPATNPVMCLSSTVAEDITSLTPVVLSGTVPYNSTNYTYNYNITPTYGLHTYAVYSTGYDANGKSVQSQPASVVVDVEPKLNTPTGLTAAVQ